MPRQLYITRAAEEGLKDVPHNQQKKLQSRFNELISMEHPTRHYDSMPIHCTDGNWHRLKVYTTRLIYSVLPESLTVHLVLQRDKDTYSKVRKAYNASRK